MILQPLVFGIWLLHLCRRRSYRDDIEVLELCIRQLFVLPRKKSFFYS